MKQISIARPAVAVLIALGAASTQAQLVNYSEAMSAYKDARSAGVQLNDGVTPGISAKASVARALRRSKVTDQSALVQPDGSLALPANQTNLVIRSRPGDVQRSSDGQVRIASPTIQGNVYGNVTLFVDGEGLENVTVLNSGR